MASMHQTVAHVGASDRPDNIVPAYVIEQKRQERAARIRRASGTIIASAISEEATGAHG
jgi:hypothetical protein